MGDFDFFVLVPRIEGPAATEFLEADGTIFGDVPCCQLCGQAVGMRPWLPPFRVEIDTWGALYGDLAYACGGSILVSARFKQIYDESGLRGLSGFEPIEVVRVTRHKRIEGDMPRYLKATVFRGDTAIDPEASGVEWEDQSICPKCLIGRKLKRRRRIVIDQNTWTGEDIFFARGLPGEFITSKRLKDVCEATHVQNAVFVPSIHRR